MNQYEGLTVQRIDFPDLPAASAKRLLDLIPQKAGAPLQRENVRQSIQILHSTGRFADIQVEAERMSGLRSSLQSAPNPISLSARSLSKERLIPRQPIRW